MDYEKIYNSIILKAKNRKSFRGYSEKHHVIPKCLGGSNKRSNLVLLTAKEHFICHHLLACFTQHPSLCLAFFGMCNGWKSKYNLRDYGVSSKTYENIKNLLYGPNGILTGKSHYSFGSKHSIESKKLMSHKAKESWKSGNRKLVTFRKPLSENTKIKMSKAKKGKFKGSNNSFAKQCSICGQIFGSAREVTEKYSVTYRTVLNRIYSDKFPEWFYC